MEFTKLSEVAIVETATDDDKVLIEQNGEIKRVPKTEVGGGGGNMPQMPGGFGGNFSDIESLDDMFNSTANYVSEIDSAMNLTVVFQMLGIGLLLTLFASAASILFIMRYDPLKILANRD